MLINEAISWVEAVGTYGIIRVSWLQPVTEGFVKEDEESSYHIETIRISVLVYKNSTQAIPS